jgi:hypothetical protein
LRNEWDFRHGWQRHDWQHHFDYQRYPRWNHGKPHYGYSGRHWNCWYVVNRSRAMFSEYRKRNPKHSTAQQYAVEQYAVQHTAFFHTALEQHVNWQLNAASDVRL